MIDYIKVQKTARVVTEGTNNPNLRSVWLIAHGYGQLATFFISKFEKIYGEENLIIVPEGLHRYYINGFIGRIGASWMTAEEREKDIEDYRQYLDIVYETYIKPLDKKVIVNALGFSQGGATICRWAAYTKNRIDNLIVWGSNIPPDMDWETDVQKLRNLNWHYVAGDNDEFLSEKRRGEQLLLLEKNGIIPNSIHYQGTHDIFEEPLLLLNKNVLKNS
ncbi:MAG TPA: alpha/beta fold hydrolase [Bacteroidia bacterium]|jgi:predicted esterase|nr:alpha/beta fold hydrolase [Bacteroidia bacterium]